MIDAALSLIVFPLAAVEVTPKVRAAYWLLLLTAGTLLVVFVLTILLVRILRRYRQTYLSQRRKPTPNDDVWSQYRLPDESGKDDHSEEDDSPEA